MGIQNWKNPHEQASSQLKYILISKNVVWSRAIAPLPLSIQAILIISPNYYLTNNLHYFSKY